MKKIIYTILLLFLCTSAFCADPPDFGDHTDPNPTDQAPIDEQLSIMVTTAIFLGIYMIARKK